MNTVDEHFDRVVEQKRQVVKEGYSTEEMSRRERA